MTTSTTTPPFERWLDEHDIAWELHPELPIADIDLAASLANQTRLEALSEDVVARYADAMAAGEQFPPVVARRHPMGRLSLIGGNHRVAAAGRAGITHLAAYVVDVDDAQALEVAWEDNRRHGLPPTSAERDAMILRLHARGRSAYQIARAIGASQPHVHRVLGSARGDTRAEAAGIDGWRRLGQTVRARINDITDDVAFAAAAELAVDTHMRTKEVDAFVDRILRAEDTVEALALIGTEHELRSRDSIDRRGRGHPTRDDQAFHALSRALVEIKGISADAAAAAASTADRREVLQRRIFEAAEVMSKTQRLLERAARGAA